RSSTLQSRYPQHPSPQPPHPAHPSPPPPTGRGYVPPPPPHTSPPPARPRYHRHHTPPTSDPTDPRCAQHRSTPPNSDPPDRPTRDPPFPANLAPRDLLLVEGDAILEPRVLHVGVLVAPPRGARLAAPHRQCAIARGALEAARGRPPRALQRLGPHAPPRKVAARWMTTLLHANDVPGDGDPPPADPHAHPPVHGLFP